MRAAPLPPCLLRLPLLILGCLLLQACATGNSAPAEKIGMHFDAVLEFVIEYPLAWHKERLLADGGREGEIRWAHPDHPATLLRVRSILRQEPAIGMEQQISGALRGYPGLEELSREQVLLAAGEAWHVTGKTPQGSLDIILLCHAQRCYLIALTAAPEDMHESENIMARVTRSFRVTAARQER